MVSLPAEIMMTLSSDMRLMDFSSRGNVLDSISSKMVRGFEGSLLLPGNGSTGFLSFESVLHSWTALNARAFVS